MELPRHLAGHSAAGLVPGEPIAQFEIGDTRNLIYLILDWRDKTAAIVDPQRDLAPPLDALAAHGFRLERIFLTHTHSDHTAGVPELLRRQPGIELHFHESDFCHLPQTLRSVPNLRPIVDGDTVVVGSLKVEVMHTPGHSAGECCYFLGETTPPYLLTGDTVFIRDCGRTDLPTGDTREMFASLRRISGLPHPTVILPGHHYRPETASTLAKELAESPPFRCKSVEELEALP